MLYIIIALPTDESYGIVLDVCADAYCFLPMPVIADLLATGAARMS